MTRPRGHPLQVICRGVSVDIEFCDLVGERSAEATIEARVERDRKLGFTLDDPPLLRIVLYRLARDRHEMLLSQPHLLQDGWSAMNVLNEVFEAYEAFVGGHLPRLEPVRPVREFIDWLEARDRGHMEAFWRAQLAGFTNPTRMTRPNGRTGESDYVRHFRPLDSELSESLRKLARGQKISLSAVLVGALAVLIGRYNDCPDVVFCIVAAGRPPALPGIESMVGMFINTLPLRIQVDEDSSLAPWLHHVHARQASLLEHEHSPLSEVQSWSELGPGVQLTDTLLAFGNFPTGSVAEGSLKYRTVDGYGRGGFPFSVTIEAADQLKIGLHFAPSEFDVSMADQIFDHLITLLRSMVAEPNTTVGALRMLSEGEIESLTKRQAVVVPAAPQACFPHLFARQVAATPNSPAAVFGEEVLSYRQLDTRSNKLAHHLTARGLQKGSRAAICLERSLDVLVALLAVQKAGAAFVPLDPAFPPERLQYMVDDSRALLLVTTEPLLESSFPEPPETVITLDTERPAIDQQLERAPDTEVTPSDLAYVIYTSGSTGRPKGVEVEHAALTNCLMSMRERPGMTANDVVLAITTLTFDPSLLEFFLPLTVGAMVVIASESTVRHDLSLSEALERWGVTVMFATPTRWQLLLASGWSGKRDLTVHYGGEPMSRELADRLLVGNRAVWNLYGTTETTVWSSLSQVQKGPDAITIGDPLANTWLYILDHQMRPVPRGVAGALFIGGRGLARGYCGQPEYTESRFVPDPFRLGETIYNTGDRARLTDTGIECLGRLDHQVKVRGHRIELGEIESILASHPSVAVAAAIILEPNPRDQRLVAYYVLDPRGTATRTELRAYLKEWLPEYMLPQHFVRLDALPLTASGKLDRRGLPEIITEVETTAAYRSPRTEEERIVVEAGGDLLGLDQVNLENNFFDLGGHSLLALQLIMVLQNRTGVLLDPSVLVLNNLEQVSATLSPTVGAESTASGRPESGPWQGATDPSGSVQVTGCYFGSSAEPLFGIHHSPTGSTQRPCGVLVCGPVGWEYTHAHWAVRRLARLSVDEGFHVFRFDYSGTGDSWGDGSITSVDRWIDDIAAAAAELKVVSGVERLSIVGLRLGAALAAVSCSRGLAAEHLVLWDPVVSGDEYLRSQKRMHLDYSSFRASLASSVGRSHTPASDPADDELLGHSYPDRLRRELSEIDLRELSLSTTRTSLVASTSRPLDRSVVGASGRAIRYNVVDDVGAWDDLASREAILLISEIPAYIASLLGEES